MTMPVELDMHENKHEKQHCKQMNLTATADLRFGPHLFVECISQPMIELLFDLGSCCVMFMTRATHNMLVQFTTQCVMRQVHCHQLSVYMFDT